MQAAHDKNTERDSSRVAICVATYRRAELLRDLLASLAKLSFEKVCTPHIEVIVVDNDISRTAEPVCDMQKFPWTIRYICEPNRGIACARNRAIAESAGAGFLAFIDDDETPETRWLDELLWTQAQFQADIVSGPLLPAYVGNVPQWIRNGGFFRRPIFRTGDTVKLCSTNNVLIRSAVLARVPSFDEQFNLTGGEDSHFFLRVRECGFRMVFSSDAVVYEPITEKRANVSWLLRRGFQSGNSWALCERDLTPQASATRGCKGIAHMFRGLLRVPASLWLGRAAVVRDLQELCAGAGMLAGVLGHRFQPYNKAGVGRIERADKTGIHS
jgi:succinoglycan biosynthesis protein ExoM